VKGDDEMHMRELNARAEQMRGELAATFAVAGERLRPDRLASEASDRFADMVLDNADRAKAAAREHPLKVAGIAAIIGAVLARRPLSRLLSQGMAVAWRHFQERHRRTAAEDPTTETQDPIAEESEEPHGT